MILLILAVWYGYKKARDTGRNPFLWAAISAGVFLGIQFVVAFGLSAVAIIGGWDINGVGVNAIVSLAAIVLSVGGLMLVFRYLDRVPEEPPASEPPPPPVFHDNP